jgi:peptide/nickel transport system permease protein
LRKINYKFIGKKAVGFTIILFIALLLNFIIPRLIPGGPAAEVKAFLEEQGIPPTPKLLHAVEVEMGISTAPEYVQFYQYLVDVAHGNLGVSILYYPEAVSKIVEQALPWTLLIVISATVISFFIGNKLGRYAALKRNSWKDKLIVLTTMFAGGIPAFSAGIILLYVFSFDLHILPPFHPYNLSTTTPGFNLPFILSVIDHAILPVTTLTVISLATWMLHMRNNMIPTITDDYINFAKMLGVSNAEITKIAYRNALLPNLTGFAMALAYSVSGALLIEEIFSYPGIGYYMFTAIQGQDYPLMQGLFLILVVSVLVANLIVDLIYGIFDPRVTAEAG